MTMPKKSKKFKPENLLEISLAELNHKLLSVMLRIFLKTKKLHKIKITAISPQRQLKILTVKQNK